MKNAPKMNFKIEGTVSSTGGRNVCDYIVAASVKGILDGSTIDTTPKTFAKNRDEYNALKASGKLGKCVVSGRPISNSHYTVKLKDGKTAFIGDAIGKALIQLNGCQSDTDRQAVWKKLMEKYSK